MCTYDYIVYSINYEDLQTYANQELGRAFSGNELALIENKIGDYINWYEAIDAAVKSLEMV